MMMVGEVEEEEHRTAADKGGAGDCRLPGHTSRRH